MGSPTTERLGISAATDTKIELRFNWSEDELQQVFRATYEHVFGRERVYVGGIFAPAESQLRDGSINVRQFVQALAKSEFYKERFFYNNPQVRFIELNYQHLLGRAVSDQSEIAYHVDLYASQGYDAEIDSYIYSAEYDSAFGSDTAPYYRGFKSIPGMKQVEYNRLFQLYRGNGSSDNAQVVGKSSRLQQQVAMNQPSAVVAPSTQSIGSFTFGRLATSLAQGDNRVYLVEAIKGGAGTKAGVRRSRVVYTVPFDQLSSRYQEIVKSGGKIVSVKPA